MQLSSHFTLEELTRSQTALRTGIDNTPTPTQIGQLQRLCETLLEPVRDLLGVPLHIDSGFRCPTLNAAVGGASNSAHLDGRAADIVPETLTLPNAFDAIRASDLPFDQLIIECNAWIHIAVAADGNPRRECLTASGGPGHWTYTRVV